MKKLYLLLPILFLIYWGCEDEQDTTSPTVSITSHSSGQSVYEIVTITVTTQDNEGISKVEFFIDDSLVLTDSESPYEYEWNTTQYEDNSEHTVKVISYDNFDNSTTSQPILLIVDNSESRPTPSELYPIIPYSFDYQINWSQNNDDDFDSYKLYYSRFEDMSYPYYVFGTIERLDTNYVITDLSYDDHRFYQIITEDDWGLHSNSNIIDIRTLIEIWGQIYFIGDTYELNLQPNDTIPSDIGYLIRLRRLYLSFVTGFIPPEIGNLYSLVVLSIGNSPLTGEIPQEIGNLVNLERLYLSHNQLTGEIPEEIGNLVSLISLNLIENQLTGEIPQEIGNLTNLERLYLKENQLTGEIPQEIWNLVELDHLNLSHNQLTGEIPESICDLGIEWDDLNRFNITYNKLCPPYPSCIEDYVGEQDTSGCD